MDNEKRENEFPAADEAERNAFPYADDDDEPVEGAITGGADEPDDAEDAAPAADNDADEEGEKKDEEKDNEKEKTKKNSISSDLIRGHINTIILRTLYEGDRYGYDIINEIEHKSHGQYTLKQPTLYSALKRLESQGYVKSYWGGVSNGGRRRYFSLTEAGREIAEQNQAEWEYSRTIIDSLISENDFDFSNPAPEKLDFRILRQATSRTPIIEEGAAEPYPDLIFNARESDTAAETKPGGTIDTVETVTAEFPPPLLAKETEGGQADNAAPGESGQPSAEALNAERQAAAEAAGQTQTEAQTETQTQVQPPEPQPRSEEIPQTPAAAQAQEAAYSSAYTATSPEPQTPAAQVPPQAGQAFPQNGTYTYTDNPIPEAGPQREDTAGERAEDRPIPPLYITRTDEERNYKEIVSRIYRAGIKRHDMPPVEEPPEPPETETADAETAAAEAAASAYAPAGNGTENYATSDEPAVRYNETAYETSRPLTPGRIDFQDVEEQARYDGLRVWTAGGAAQKREMPENFFNKGLALLRASLIFFAFAIVETVLVAVFREQLGLQLWYMIAMLVCAVLPPAVCAVLCLAKFQPCCKRLKNNTAIYNGIVIFLAAFILLVAVDLIADVNLTDGITVINFIVIPFVYLLNIVVFAVSYYFLSRSKV